ncbi:MAG: glycosyltransferase family 39 protein, partial [Candidatus Sumerlaeaceae bacterium]|nr:glycosyltransferase family 39 protein [Candidatus Sumerlaeaceae bacterium]
MNTQDTRDHRVCDLAALPYQPGSPLDRRAMVVVFVTALLVRLGYLLECAGQPWFGALLLDSRYVVGQAQEFATTGSLGSGALFRPPLYTLVLAGVWSLAGEVLPFAVPLLQHLLGALLCVLVYRITVRCWNLQAALAAGMCAAFYAPLVFYEGEILSDFLALLLAVAFLQAWIRGVESGRYSDFLWAGLWAGLSAVTRPAVLLPVSLLFVVGLASLLLRRGGSVPDAAAAPPRVWALASFAIPVILAVGLPTARNAAVGDPAFICSQTGINFYIGNGGAANGLNVVVPRVLETSGPYRDWVEEYAVLGWLQARHGDAEGLRRYLTDSDRPPAGAVSKYWMVRARDEMSADPVRTARLFGRKALALINNAEVRNNRDFAFVRTHLSKWLAVVPVTFGWILGPALVGAFYAVRERRRSSLWLVLLYLAGAAGGVLLFFVAGRLRLAVVPPLLVLAGVGLERMVAALCQRRWPVLSNIMAVMVLGAAVSFYHWPQVDFRFSRQQPEGLGIRAAAHPAGEFAMLAVASLETGHPDAARQFAEEAIVLNPVWGYPHLLAGNAAAARGEWAEAAMAYACLLYTS